MSSRNTEMPSLNWRDADELYYNGRLSGTMIPWQAREKFVKIWQLVDEHIRTKLGSRCTLEKEQPAEFVARLRQPLAAIRWVDNLDEVRKVIDGESDLTGALPPEVLDFARSPACDVRYFAYYMAYWAAYLEPMPM